MTYDNIKISITGNYIWARQTGPDSVEVGDIPGRASYNMDTHVAISKETAARAERVCDWLAHADYVVDTPHEKWLSKAADELRKALED